MTDRVTRRMWTRALTGPVSWAESRAQAAALGAGTQAERRLPTNKELFTLIDVRGHFAPNGAASTPLIDTRAFVIAEAI